MNKRIYLVTIVVLFVLFLLTACTPQPADPDKQPNNSDTPLDCDWTLRVDQTIPVETDGMTVNYTLVLIAQKQGGTDVYGTYEGAAYIGQNLDASSLSNSVISVTGGFDIHAFANNLSFELVPYDVDSFSRYGIGEGDAPIAPLVQYESMALISPEMTGGGVLNPFVSGIQGEQMGYDAEAYGTEAVVMKITVNSGKVQVVVPVFNIGHSFEGWLTGHPAGDNSLFDEAMDKIEELRSRPEADDSDDDMFGGLGGMMGDIMGKSGNNLALPASFATNDFPLLGDANIFNVYEKDETVRIMYGTKTAYDDVIAFYQPLIDKMNAHTIPTDVGALYTGSMGKYRSVTLTVNVDSSGTYGIIVYIEYTVK